MTEKENRDNKEEFNLLNAVKRLTDVKQQSFPYNEKDDEPKAFFAMRMRFEAALAYKQLPENKKRLARKLFEIIILDLAGKSEIEKELKDLITEDLPQPIIVNINYVDSSVKNEVRTQTSIDPSILQEKTRVLEEENRELKQLLRFYKEKFEKVRTQIAQLNLNITTKYDLEGLLEKLRRLKEEFVRTRS